MTDPAPADPTQITFGQELLRKATHMGALVFPGGYYFLNLTRWEMLSVMAVAAILMIFIDISRLRRWKFWTGFAGKIGSSIIRNHEKAGDFTGATYILVSVCLTIALFDKPIAIAALAFIIVGDSFAAVIGRKFGRHKIGRKSVEGSLGCLGGCLIVAAFVPSLAPIVLVIGTIVATVVEALPVKIDDNISVPLLSGLAMMLTEKIVSF